MADDVLRQLYVKVGRTLSIAHEVYQQLKRDGMETATTPVLRLKLEADTWQPTLDLLETYELAVSEFTAANAVWEHGGQIGKQPEKPKRPAELPKLTFRTDYCFETISDLIRHANSLQEVITNKRSQDRFNQELSMLADALGYIGHALSSIKNQLDDDDSKDEAREVVDDVPANGTSDSEQNQPIDQTPIVDELVTLDQVAPLAG